MNTSASSPDFLEESNLPVPELPALPSINESLGSNSVSSTSARGADIFQESDALENGISQDLLEDCETNMAAPVNRNISHQDASETALEYGMSQDLLEDSMQHDPGTACDPIAQQHVTATSTDSSTHCPKKRTSFVNQCIRATKTFFMLDQKVISLTRLTAIIT